MCLLNDWSIQYHIFHLNNNNLHDSYFSVVPPACEHTACFTSNGKMTSANYPNDYDADTTDSWLITAPAGQNVTIYFVDFIIPNSVSCNVDYVILYDGDSVSDPRIGDNRYCSLNSPGCRETSSNNLLVTLTSSIDGFQIRGFSAKFYFGGKYE